MTVTQIKISASQHLVQDSVPLGWQFKCGNSNVMPDDSEIFTYILFCYWYTYQRMQFRKKKKLTRLPAKNSLKICLKKIFQDLTENNSCYT